MFAQLAFGKLEMCPLGFGSYFSSPNDTNLLDKMNKRDCLPLCRVTCFTVLPGLFFACTCQPAHAAESGVPGKLPRAPERSFSIVVIPDTQQYRGRGTKVAADSEDGALTNRVLDSWTDWIAANLDRQRIAFVSHVGDIVDLNNREQLAFARRCMDKVHGRVPYGISVGNHDMIPGSGDSSLFQEVFPKSRFEQFKWYGGCFTQTSGSSAISGNNANSVQLFEVAGMEFVVLHLECNAPDDVLQWANDTLHRYSDRRAIVTTHMGLGPRVKPKTGRDYFDAPKGRMLWSKCHGKRGNTSQQMWDKCFKLHENLFLVCCGDQSRTQAMRQKSTGQHGNVVHELLSDYGTNGLRVMRFMPAKNQVEVRTWDPRNGVLCESTTIVKDRGQHCFTLAYEMRDGRQNDQKRLK